MSFHPSTYQPSTVMTANLCSEPGAENKYAVCAGLAFQENLALGNGFVKIPPARPTCTGGTGDPVVPASGVLSYAITPFPVLQC
jgi:hypothetical protein